MLGQTTTYTQEEAVAQIGNLQKTLKVISLTDFTDVPYAMSATPVSAGNPLSSVTCPVSTVGSPGSLTCTANVVSDAAGVGTASAYFVGPTGRTVLPLTFTPSVTVPAGSNTTYALTSTIRIPSFVEPGTYKIATAGAFSALTTSHAGTVLLATPSSPALSITSNLDTKPPALTSFYCTQGQTITLSPIGNSIPINCVISATDDLSGA